MNPEPARESSRKATPQVDVQAVQRLLRDELSLSARLPYVFLMQFAAGMVIVVGSLWWTEEGLPLRTQVAFAAMCAVGLGWVAFCIWVLTRRRVLYARQQIVSSRLAMAFCAVFTVSSAVVGWQIDALPGGLLAAGCGGVMFAAAYALYRRAERQHQNLLRLRRSLEEPETAATLAA
ncbi:MAG: hypothetical protein AAF560_17225 [Acidobacteriota bacterium]